MKTAVGSHDCLDTCSDGRRVGGSVNVAQFRFSRLVITLVLSIYGAAISHEMFGIGNDVIPIQKFIGAKSALKALNNSRCIRDDNTGVF